MKKILFIGLIILSTISCKAQVIAVENFKDYPHELTEGTHVKDINNVLGKFVGTWKGTYNNKNYEFRIIKYTRTSTKRNLKFDKLLIRYKITDTNNTVIEDTTTLPNDSMFVIKGSYLTNHGSYVLYYQGKNYKCGQNGDIFMGVYGTNNTKMKLFLSVDGEMYDCTKPAQQILPTKSMELTKQ
jgi:hypothetical protein